MAEANPITAFPARLILLLIRGYRFFLSPWLGNQCRFHPTCSEYAIESIKGHGVLKGALLAGIRLSKCQPLHSGGYDPVPPAISKMQTLPKPESLLDLPGKS